MRQWLKPRLHQQLCRRNIVECYKSNDSFEFRQSRMLLRQSRLLIRLFDKVERCFDIVAVLATMSWATRFFIFIFSLFFVSGPCARLSWPSRQLLSARKSTVSYRIVFRPFDKIETNRACSIWFDFVKSTKFQEKLVRHSCQKRQQCRSNIRLCRSNIRPCSIQQCCFEIVADVDED